VLLVGAEASLAWDFDWIDQYGTAGSDSIGGLALEGRDLYSVGSESGTLPDQTSAGSEDAYVRRYDVAGNVVWTRQFGTPSFELGTGVATDATGAYVSGVTLGAFPPASPAGGIDVFVRKYTAAGDALWTTQLATAGRDFTIAIAAHATGVYVLGSTTGTFPGQSPGQGRNLFLARLDPVSGAVVWVRQFGDRGAPITDFGGLAVDDSGLYAGGHLFPADVGVVRALRRFDVDGNVIWARDMVYPGPCGSFLSDLAVSDGDLYVTSQADDTFFEDCNPEFPGSGTVGVLQKHAAGDGALVWTRQLDGGSGEGHDEFTGAKAVAVSDAGVFVAANLTSTFPGFSPSVPRSDRSECSGLFRPFADELDAYIRRYDTDGDVVWTHQFGSGVFDGAFALKADATGAYAAGDTSCRIDPGETYFGGDRDAFVLRMHAQPTSLAGQVQLLVGQLETLSDQEILDSGGLDSLVEKLEAALRQLSAGNHGAARHQLEAFVTEVDTLEQRGDLSTPQATELVDSANAIIAQL
jgi:hypothetical protein